MARSKKYDETEILETAEGVEEGSDVEIVESEEEYEEETDSTEDTEEVIDWSHLKDYVDELDTTSIINLKDYCQEVIKSRRVSETEELERQMMEIQAKLLALKGSGSVIAKEKGTKTARPIINPNNPSQIYKFGKHPKWLQELIAEETAKDPTKPTFQIMDELRETSKSII